MKPETGGTRKEGLEGRGKPKLAFSRDHMQIVGGGAQRGEPWSSPCWGGCLGIMWEGLTCDSQAFPAAQRAPEPVPAVP